MSTPLWARTVVGDGPDLVILHGLFGDKGNWKTLASKISGWRVHLFDLPGHGATPTPDSWRTEDLAERLWENLAYYGLQQPVILGHSWGGKVAWEAALQRPEAVRGLIIGDIGPGTTPLDIESVAETLIKAGQSDRDGAKQALYAAFPAPLAGFFLKSWLGGLRPWVFDLEGIVSHSNILRQGLNPGRVYPGPALQLWGALSHYPTDAAREESSRFLRRSSERFIANAGHWFHAENPSQTLENLTAFLSTLPPLSFQ